MKSLTCAVAFLFLFATAAFANPIQLITNGDFETGTFAAWTVANRSSGDWYIAVPGAPTPNFALSTSSAGGLAHGSFYALGDQRFPGSNALLQTFTVAPGSSSIILSFDMFANNYDGGPFGTTLDLTLSPNQHATVDILIAAADPFDTGAGVLRNFYVGADTGANPNPFTHYSFDVTSLLSTGGTFQLRFAQVDNQNFFNTGVDNVSILETPVPEPGSLILLLSGFALAGLFVSVGKRLE